MPVLDSFLKIDLDFGFEFTTEEPPDETEKPEHPPCRDVVLSSAAFFSCQQVRYNPQWKETPMNTVSNNPVSELEMVNVMLNRHTWVVVADSEKALFLCNGRDMKNVQLGIIHQMHHSNPATREQGSDRPGRFSSGPGLGRSAVEDTDWHEISKKRFAKEIADALYGYAHRGEFERLVIVAPPLMLGEMRQEFHKEVSDRIVSEIPKTLTNHSTNDIQSILEEG